MTFAAICDFWILWNFLIFIIIILRMLSKRVIYSQLNILEQTKT